MALRNLNSIEKCNALHKFDGMFIKIIGIYLALRMIK